MKDELTRRRVNSAVGRLRCEQSMNSFFQSREVPAKWAVPFVIGSPLLIALGFGGLFFTDFMESRARHAVLASLNDLSPNGTLTINGQARETEPVLEALRSVQHIASHHSSPLTPIQKVDRRFQSC